LRGALTQVYERSRAQLRAVAARYVGHDAEDVVQEAFLSALRCGDGFRGQAEPLTWLHRIVVNACINQYRKHKGRRHAYLRHPNRPLTVDAGVEDALALREALRTLTSDQRQVFVMYEVMGFSHNETAQLLAIPVGTSKWRLSKARICLQQLLASGEMVQRRARRRRDLATSRSQNVSSPYEDSS